MPTILTLKLEQPEQVLALLNTAKKGTLLTAQELGLLKSCINNSMVGLSKLLHFINPEIYAIWDSKVFKYITCKKSSYGIDKPNSYLDYLEALKALMNHPDFDPLFAKIQAKFSYPISPIRAIEIVIFQASSY